MKINSKSKIAKTSKIYENVFIIGKCEIGENTIIYPNTTIINSNIGDNCVITSSHIENSVIKNNVTIGPFAHLRPNCVIENNCKIGNFVEIKNSVLHEGTKASHLAYIGDAEIGKNCNIGCGVIFANYNGKTKNKTVVGDNCFIGSNSNLIAPLKIASNTYICAGTTQTINTEEFDFVIGRSRETIKKGLAKKYLGEKK